MSKRTIVSVEMPADMVEDIKQMQVVLPISKSDIIRLALRHYLKHVAPRLPGASSMEDPYAEDDRFPGCDNCQENRRD